MFKRRDVIRTFYLLAVIIVIMVTLSQILVVHRRNHHSNKSRDAYKAREMLAVLLKLEESIEAMMKKEYLPARTFKDQLQALVYAERIKQNIAKLKLVNQIPTEKKHRAFDDGAFTAFRERKLRFLEKSYDYLTPKVKIDNDNASAQKDGFVHKVNGEIFRGTDINIEINTNVHLKRKSKSLAYFNKQKANSENFRSDAKIPVLSNDKVLDFTYRYDYNQGHSWSSEQQTRNTDTVEVILDEKCPDIPFNLEGKAAISLRVPDFHSDERRFSDVQSGGFWKPSTCVARQRIAIVIPYRDRETHLHSLLHYLIPVLKRQLLEFRIFVSEQVGDLTFNKGRVMNAGFIEALKLWAFDCAIFHDVDLLPENDKNMYTCGQFPRHMSISVDKFSYRLPYLALVGGVFSIRRDQFLRVNGYSNLYWGWGAEDDDMAYRLKSSNLKIERPPATVGRYKMIKHANRETSPLKMRDYLLKTVKKRYHREGLNTLDYKLVFVNTTKLYTHVMVDIGQPPQEAENITKLFN